RAGPWRTRRWRIAQQRRPRRAWRTAAREHPEAGGSPRQQRLRRCAVTRHQTLKPSLWSPPIPTARVSAAQHALTYGMRQDLGVTELLVNVHSSVTMFHPRQLASALALVLGCAGVAHAGSAPFDNVVVFGDSLSDTGQFFSTSLNDYTKFTVNPGKVAVQIVANNYGFDLQPSRVGGSDYAFGGAGVVTDDDGADPSIPTVTQQVTGYLANGAKADPHSLYMVWGGANDIFYHSTQYGLHTLVPSLGETEAQATANINAAATQELVLINQLKQAGANYVVVFNLPDIGATPS